MIFEITPGKMSLGLSFSKLEFGIFLSIINDNFSGGLSRVLNWFEV